MAILKNKNHEVFSHGIAKLWSEGVKVTGEEAEGVYLTLGLSTAHARASAMRLLRRPDIKKRVDEIRANIEYLTIEKTAVDAAWVREKLIENVNRAMTVEKVRDRNGEPTGEFTYNGSVANQALKLLGTDIGMFADQGSLDINHNYVISDKPMDDKEWENKYKAEEISVTEKQLVKEKTH